MAVSRTSYDPTPPVNPSAMIPGHYPVDDWIDIGQGLLATLVKQYITHLGKESYFDLV